MARACASIAAVPGSPARVSADVVAHPVDVAAGAAEVDLPVDADQRDVLGVNRAVVGPGVGIRGDRADAPRLFGKGRMCVPNAPRARWWLARAVIGLL